MKKGVIFVLMTFITIISYSQNVKSIKILEQSNKVSVFGINVIDSITIENDALYQILNIAGVKVPFSIADIDTVLFSSSPAPNLYCCVKIQSDSAYYVVSNSGYIRVCGDENGIITELDAFFNDTPLNINLNSDHKISSIRGDSLDIYFDYKSDHIDIYGKYFSYMLFDTNNTQENDKNIALLRKRSNAVFWKDLIKKAGDLIRDASVKKGLNTVLNIEHDGNESYEEYIRKAGLRETINDLIGMAGSMQDIQEFGEMRADDIIKEAGQYDLGGIENAVYFSQYIDQSGLIAIFYKLLLPQIKKIQDHNKKIIEQREKEAHRSTIIYNIKTGSSKDVTYNSSYCSIDGIIRAEANKGEFDFDYGICYSTSTNPTIEHNVKSNVSSTGGFSLSAVSLTMPLFFRINSLEPNVTYFYKAYIKDNITGNLIFADNTEQFTTLDKPIATTGNYSVITDNSAMISCSYNKIFSGIICGVEYWSDDTHLEKTIEINEDGVVEIELTDLLPNTTYYYRAFIKYGAEYIRANETKTFTTEQKEPEVHLCPNDHHPHLIDLGLQSGTKWACCNVGAASPADYGGYFAWGETQAREEFTWGADYALYNTTTFDFDYIGEDIAGTKYDAATANWGDSWQMPNRAQCKELFLSCSYMVKNMNGIDGWEFTGPNGGKIFIPFAGTIEYTRNDWSGYRGFYWTSNNYDSNSVMASGFIFDKDWGWNVSGVEGQNDGHIRCYGETIRPVQPGITVTTGDATEITVSSATLHGSCSKGISTAGFSVKKEGESEYVQYNAYPDEEGNFSATIEDLDIETKYFYYAFVQTDEKTYKGEELSLSTKPLCPDDKHPHLIDLGLPSGTKWACCNVGASRPEENGNYYAWGDGSEKTEFYMDTYLYQEYSEIAKTVICSYIGEDISGTEYDIALQKWGNPWCMPSKDDYEELMANCKIYEVTYKGEKGTLFVAPNGKNVFMKPQGYRDCCDLHGTEQGVYWTSTYSHVDSVTAEWAKYINAYAFQFMGDYVYINGEHSRVYGYAVRPIAK